MHAEVTKQRGQRTELDIMYPSRHGDNILRSPATETSFEPAERENLLLFFYLISVPREVQLTEIA